MFSLEANGYMVSMNKLPTNKGIQQQFVLLELRNLLESLYQNHSTYRLFSGFVLF